MTHKTLIALNKSEILTNMDLIEKYIRPAFDTGIGEQKWETVIARALVGDLLIWIAWMDDIVVGAASTEIINFDGYNCVHIITSGTDNHVGFEDFHIFLYNYAKNTGCKNLQFWGRKGWSRAADKIFGAKDEKYKEVYRVFSMEINYDESTEPNAQVSKSLGDCSA